MGRTRSFVTPTRLLLLGLTVGLLSLLGAPVEAFAHGVAEGDAGYLQEVTGDLLVPFAYLGAKHMVTGYDHLLFLPASSSSCTA